LGKLEIYQCTTAKETKIGFTRIIMILKPITITEEWLLEVWV
jgi:hypothetical protein